MAENREIPKVSFLKRLDLNVLESELIGKDITASFNNVKTKRKGFIRGPIEEIHRISVGMLIITGWSAISWEDRRDWERLTNNKSVLIFGAETKVIKSTYDFRNETLVSYQLSGYGGNVVIISGEGDSLRLEELGERRLYCEIFK